MSWCIYPCFGLAIRANLLSFVSTDGKAGAWMDRTQMAETDKPTGNLTRFLSSLLSQKDLWASLTLASLV